MNFYHFVKFTVGKPEVITNWLFFKQRTHELTIVFLWFIMVGVIIFSQWYVRVGMFLIFNILVGQNCFFVHNKVEACFPGKIWTCWASEMLVFGILVGYLRYHVIPPSLPPSLPPSPPRPRQRRLTRAWLIYNSLKMDMKKSWDDINRVILLNP